jgi:hypothetical protein
LLTKTKERIRLLVHILCELRTTYGITARKLKASDQPIRRQILPAERLEILDEVYQVREEEEKLLDGVTGMMMEYTSALQPAELTGRRWKSHGVDLALKPSRCSRGSRQPWRAKAGTGPDQ